MKKRVDILKSVRDRISNPLRWTTKVMARDADGNKVDSDSDAAICWCVSGAYAIETRGDPSRLLAWYYINRCSQAKFGKDIVDVNDDPNHGHPAVMEILDEAIEELEDGGY